MPINELESVVEYPEYPFEEMGLSSHIPPTLDEIKGRLTRQIEAKDAGSTSPLEALTMVPASSAFSGKNGIEHITMRLTEEIDPPRLNRQRLFQGIITSARRRSNLPAIWYYDGNKDRFEVVAEIFDPLCFKGINPPAVADSAYARTAKTYETLTDRQSVLIPEYYGSYTMRVPVSNSSRKFREVRIILRKPIQGIGLNKFLSTCSPDDQLTIMNNSREADELEEGGVLLMPSYLQKALINVADELEKKGVSLGPSCLQKAIINVESTIVQAHFMIWYFAEAEFRS
ncbi:hypothetical protein TRVA0_038S00144 [Trichomonascus vanleenenianus]|uniref:uncharacterized protein n=1 Tax=Trichomonascus vanleenenianus TaxID=2268995 RepID=UPI003ECAFFFD